MKHSTITDLDATVRDLLARHGRLRVEIASLSRFDDLHSAGLTSHACVDLMLALEDEFDIEFPERFLKRQTFACVANLSDAVLELT